MHVKIGGNTFRWEVAGRLNCCGCREHSRLSPMGYNFYEERVPGDFNRFVDAFLYHLYTQSKYVHVIADRKGGMWDRYLFSKLGERMELELANGSKVYFKCSFSGWTRNPNTGRLVQLVTIIRE